MTNTDAEILDKLAALNEEEKSYLLRFISNPVDGVGAVSLVEMGTLLGKLAKADKYIGTLQKALLFFSVKVSGADNE